MPQAPVSADAPQVALFLDAAPTRDFMAYVAEFCRERRAVLICLAPPPPDLAVSRLEPHLSTLAQAGVPWEILAVDSAPETTLPDLLRRRPGIALLACESGSVLARCQASGTLDRLQVPVLMLLGGEAVGGRAKPDSEPTVDWLSPCFNRGF